MSQFARGPADFLDLGDWNAACSECGRKRKASYLVKNWQGLWRCPEHNEPRHPQEYVRAVPDIQTPPWVQPETDVFSPVCFPNDQTAIADWAVADCAICDYISPLFDPNESPSTHQGDTISFVGVEHFQGITSSSVVVTLPVSVLDGDFMVLATFWDTAAKRINAPVGWTEFSWSPLAANVAPGDVSLRMFWKVASGEPPSFLLTRAGGAVNWHGVIFAYRGCNPAGPLDVDQGTIDGTGATPNIWYTVGITPTKVYTRVIDVISQDFNVQFDRTFGASTGHLLRGVFTMSGPVAGSFPLMLQELSQHLPGPTGSYQGTISPTDSGNLIGTIVLVSIPN